jgi:hypothetical protein
MSTSGGSRLPLSAEADYIFGVSETLTKHPKFFACLPEIISYLRLSDKGWAFVLHARRDSHDSPILQECDPRLFTVPNDIVSQVDTLRSAEKWNHWKNIILDNFSGELDWGSLHHCEIELTVSSAHTCHVQKLSLQIPEPQYRPTSYASTSSSARSSLPPYSGSEQSARSSMSSGYISDWSAHDHHRVVSYSRALWEAESAARSLTPSPAVQRARKLVEPLKCPCCPKLYEKYGFLVSHMKLKHPNQPAAQQYIAKEFRDLPTKTSIIADDPRESMPPPSASAVTNEATIGLVAFASVAEEKPLPPFPPVHAKEGSKRSLPDSPSSQFGPRMAKRPSDRDRL